MLVLVSVLMASYNHEKYISEAIESVLNQTFKDFELIIIDDGSKDHSKEIIKEYQNKDTRIRAFFHEKNMGIAKTSNEILSLARGNFVAFIGSDDVWVATKLEKQLDLLKHDEEKVIWSDGEIIDSKGSNTGRTVTQLLIAQTKKSGDLFEDLLVEQTVFGQSLIFKSEYLRDLSFDDQLKYANDHKFLADLARKHLFLFIPEPLAKYRMHGKNITLVDEKGWMKDRILIRKYFLQKYGSEISVRTRSNLYYKIGSAFLRLGKKMTAKQYYLKALSTDYFHVNSVLYVILVLTRGEGFIGNFLVNSYHTLNSLLARKIGN